MDNTRVFHMAFASVYPHYVAKAEKKGRTKEELHTIIHWLTGYDEKALAKVIANKTNFETFFAQAPRLNPNVSKITGVICGYRVEEIEGVGEIKGIVLLLKRHANHHQAEREEGDSDHHLRQDRRSRHGARHAVLALPAAHRRIQEGDPSPSG